MSTGSIRREGTQNELVDAASPRIVGMGKTLATNTPFFVVTSLSEQARCHIVLRYIGRLECDCLASRHGKMCSHRRVVHDYLVAETKFVTPRAVGEPDARESMLNRTRPFSLMKT